jgi:hypothetical protein
MNAQTLRELMCRLFGLFCPEPPVTNDVRRKRHHHHHGKKKPHPIHPPHPEHP